MCFQREKIWDVFYDPPGICSKDIKDNKDATQVVTKWKFVSAVLRNNFVDTLFNYSMLK